MSFAPTIEQATAIKTIDTHVGVTAGAGSGKTRVLVERYINLLTKGFSVRSIVAITFTRKAALEMKERIQATVNEMPALNYLRQEIHTAQVSTIHSLCQQILKDYPREAGIDPRFSLGEEWEMEVILQDVIVDVVAEAISGEDEYFIQFCQEFRRIKDTYPLLQKVYQQMLGKGETTFRVADKRREITNDLALYVKQLAYSLKELKNYDKQSLTSNQASRLTDLLQEYQEIQPLLTQVEQLLIGCARFGEALKGNWGKLKQEIDPVKELHQSLEQAALDLRGNCYLLSITKVLQAIHQRYQEHKLSKGLLDYNDLELLCLKVLKTTAVAEDYQIKHLVVDEFQDTNRLQRELIQHLQAPNTKLFVVGDPKQSIYRFRGAEVEVFSETCQEITTGGGLVIGLKDNFRSRPGIIQFANAFFSHLMQGDPVDYQASRGKRESSLNPNVELLVSQPGEDALDNRKLESQSIATRIKDLLAANPQFSYKDIAILFRQMSNVEIFEQALLQAGIPYVNLSSRGFYGKPEIRDIVNFISWLLDPLDQVAKMAVLRSPFFALTDQGLFWLSHNKPEKMTSADQAKFKRAQEVYDRFQLVASKQPAHILLPELLEETHYILSLLGLPFADQAIANVEKLLDKSGELAAKGYLSLGEQLRYIQVVMAGSGKEGEARLDVEQADVVKLMTIHGSKGLEFPVVILADLGGKARRSDGSFLQYHPDFGLAAKDTKAYSAIKEQVRQEELQEGKRLLYVAMTRAEEYLILAGNDEIEDVSKPLDKMENWWQWIWWGIKEISASLYQIQPATLGSQERDVAVAESSGEYQANLPLPLYPLSEIIGGFRPLQFSVTSLMVYSRCPRAYFYQYVLQIPEEPSRTTVGSKSKLSPLAKGNIIHRVCELITKPEMRDKLLTWAIDMEGVEVRESDRLELEALTDRYLQSDFFLRANQAQSRREVEFLLPVGDSFISGTIDQLILGESGYTIMDLKTNAISKREVNQVALRYDWQLRIYAWAAHKMLGVPPIRAELYFLLPNQVYTHPTAISELAYTEQWLTDTIEQIRHGAELGISAFPAGEGCLYCNYPCEHSALQKKVD